MRLDGQLSGGKVGNSHVVYEVAEVVELDE